MNLLEFSYVLKQNSLDILVFISKHQPEVQSIGQQGNKEASSWSPHSMEVSTLSGGTPVMTSLLLEAHLLHEGSDIELTLNY